MFKINRIFGSAILATTFLVASAVSGCAGRVGVYDEYHSDYHQWDRHEDDSYRHYLGERHEDYRDYKKLDKDHQKDYWNWRHDHPENDRH